MLTKEDIDKNSPVIVKWDKPLTNNGNVTDGVMAGQAEEFITRIEEESELLGQLRYVEMHGETQDIQALRVRPKLQSMEKLTGNVGAQVDNITNLTEVTPGILKTTLEAHAFTAYTKVPKTFMKTNIEGEGFIAKYESLLAPGCAFSAEQIAVFGVKVSPNTSNADGTANLDGILKQLDDVAADYLDSTTHQPKSAKRPQGRYGVHWNSSSSETDKTEYIDINAGTGYYVLPQIDAMLNQFTKQRGKRKLANIYVSSELSSIMIAEASKRETDGGDKLLFSDNGNMMFRGREVIPLDVLDNYEDDEGNLINGYGDVIIIANPDSIGYGPIMEAESEAQYKVELKGYLTSVDYMFDVAVIFAEDVLYAKVNYTPKA